MQADASPEPDVWVGAGVCVGATVGVGVGVGVGAGDSVATGLAVSVATGAGGGVTADVSAGVWPGGCGVGVTALQPAMTNPIAMTTAACRIEMRILEFPSLNLRSRPGFAARQMCHPSCLLAIPRAAAAA